MKYSKYQLDIFDWVVNGSGSAVINANAGCGKSFCIVESAKRINSVNNIFMAFNKSIQTELSNKLRGTNMQAVTFHSMGLQLIKTYINTNSNTLVNNRKVDDIMKKLEIPYSQWQYVKKVVSLIKAYNIDYNNEEELLTYVIEQGIDDNRLYGLYKSIVKLMNINNKNTTEIDFDDMIYLPIKYNTPKLPKNWVFIDEFQDIVPIQLLLAEKFIGDKTRILLTGDFAQNIYGFRFTSIPKLKYFIEKYNCKEFDLPISYRCPKSHIPLVNNYVPKIEAYSGNHEGIVQEMWDFQLSSKIDNNAFIIGRTNKLVIKVILDLIKDGVKATYYGKDYGDMILSIIEKYEKSFKFDSFKQKINSEIESGMVEIKNINTKLKKIDSLDYDEIIKLKVKRFQLSQNIDLLETIYELCYRLSTFKELKKTISNVFLDSIEGVVGSTIHKVKGMEFDNVYVIQNKLPNIKEGMSHDDKIQELNLHYVAHTRSKYKLVKLNIEK